MPHYTSDTAYSGEEKIIVSIDLGTTRSAVSFAYLNPNEKPNIKMVIKWPGQPEASGDSKIPSLVAYKEGTLVACGAEAFEYIDDPEYEVAKWFKLHLHPDHMKVKREPKRIKAEQQAESRPRASKTAPPTEKSKPLKRTHAEMVKEEKDSPPPDSTISEPEEFIVPPLPKDVTLQKVYADFLGYMFSHARKFFQNDPLGDTIWARLQDRISVVLATPNGWDNDQQAFLRQAAILAGLVRKENAESHLEFVTEGEASVHYTLDHTHNHEWLKPGVIFAVMDAGGSTVDTTLYMCEEIEPKLVLKEVCASECVQAGGVFVDRAARSLLEGKLSGSKFCDDYSLNAMLEQFEKKTKRIFDGAEQSNVLHFGRGNENDRAYDIFKGRLSLTTKEVEKTFDDAIARIIGSCQRLVAGHDVHYVLLVGGFGESPYLRLRLDDSFSQMKTKVVTVEEPSKKAAAEGAVIWFIKQLVIARAARFTIGIVADNDYDPANPQHQRRSHLVVDHADGKKCLPFFGSWIKKSQVVDASLTEVTSYERYYTTYPTSLDMFQQIVHAWEGKSDTLWFTDEQGKKLPEMRTLCTLSADLSSVEPRLVKPTKGPEYWIVSFEVSVMFGGTKLQARLRWKEGDRECEGPISVIPNSVY